MLNLSGRSVQSQTDAAHNFAVLHARFMPEYSMVEEPFQGKNKLFYHLCNLYPTRI